MKYNVVRTIIFIYSPQKLLYSMYFRAIKCFVMELRGCGHAYGAEYQEELTMFVAVSIAHNNI